MNNFKYSINCEFSNKIIANEFVKSLIVLGYKGYGAVHSNKATITINSPIKYPLANKNRFEIYQTAADRDFTFNIDNKWEYEAALAIAVIRDDDKPYVGEWVIDSRSRYKSIFPEQLDKIVEISTTNGHTQYSNFNLLNYKSSWWAANFCYDVRKATPEEIIQFMKEKYKVFELPEKWCIKGPLNKYMDLVTWAKYEDCCSLPDHYYHHQERFQNRYFTDILDGYTEITYEQWKQWYDNQQTKTDMKGTNMKPENWLIKIKTLEEGREVVDIIKSIIGNCAYDGSSIGAYYGIKDKISHATFSNNNFPGTVYLSIEEWRKVFKPETTNMKKEQISFAIKGPINKYSDLFKWFNTKKRFDSSSNIYHGGAECEYFYDADIDKTGTVQGLYGKEYKTITYQQWKEMYGTEDRKIVGYKLIKGYPGFYNVGIKLVTEKGKYNWYTEDGILVMNPHISPDYWEPVYEEVKKEITIRIECDEPFTVTIEKGWDSIKMPERICDILEFKRLRENVKLLDRFNNWNLTINTVNIGCKKNIPFSYLDKIIAAWEELNS